LAVRTSAPEKSAKVGLSVMPGKHSSSLPRPGGARTAQPRRHSRRSNRATRQSDETPGGRALARCLALSAYSP
jgi:hypothetical protein